MITALKNVHVFDGENIVDDKLILIEGERILSIGGVIPTGATVIDAHNATLMPGLIDAHVHTDIDGLHDALLFGVTTPGGHPSQYMKSSNNLLLRFFYRYPFVSTPEEAVKFVKKQVANGADYIKIFIEDGTTVGFPGLRVTSNETLLAAVNEAHLLGKMAIAHVTTFEGGKKAILAGVDGLAHLFFDRKSTPELISAIASSGAFVTPTLVTLSTAFGNSAAELATDKRVSSRLSKKWLNSLSRSMNVYPQGKLEDAFASVKALHNAGVDILAGSDVSEPIPILGGLAHGASLHHELQLLVDAGLKPIEALRSATSIPARRFGLTDRGRIVPGARADLLLVDGDPITKISDTLSILNIWRSGTKLNTH